MVPCSFWSLSLRACFDNPFHRNGISGMQCRLRSTFRRPSPTNRRQTTFCELPILYPFLVSSSDALCSSAFEGTVPPHFYGQMAKTDLGCQILQEKGHFTEFVDFIRTHGHECDDSVMIMKLKSILWAVVSLQSTISRSLSPTSNHDEILG